MLDEDTKYICQMCYWEPVPYARARRCIDEEVLITCTKCGEAAANTEKRRKASMVQIPYSKGAYQYIHNPADLFHTNPKRTT
jgi:hypothetical protein